MIRSIARAYQSNALHSARVHRKLLRTKGLSGVFGDVTSSIEYSSQQQFGVGANTPTRNFVSTATLWQQGSGNVGGLPGAPSADPTPTSAPASSRTITEDIIVEVTADNFQALVLQCPVPVVVDCYANWCAPCKQITPDLVAAVNAAGGRVRLAKINTDENPQLAQALQVRSLPTIYGVFEGKMISQFTGAQPLEVIQRFIDELVKHAAKTSASAPLPSDKPKTPAEMLTAAEKLIDQGLFEDAALIYKDTLKIAEEKQPVDKDLAARSLAGLAKSAITAGAVDDAMKVVQILRKSYSTQIKSLPDVAQVVSTAELSSNAPEDTDLKDLQAKLAQDPRDCESRHKLALLYYNQFKYEDAINEALTIVKTDKHWNDGAGRSLLLQIFEALGPHHELVKVGRAKLTNLLFM